MPKKWNRKVDKPNLFALSIVIIMALLIAVAFLALPYFGMLGLFNLFASFNLVEIQFFGSWFKNVGYFGFLLLLIYFTLILLDIMHMVFVPLMKLQQTKKVILTSYAIQLAISSLFFKVVIVESFSRITITMTGTILLFTLIFLVIYVFDGDNKTE